MTRAAAVMCDDVNGCERAPLPFRATYGHPRAPIGNYPPGAGTVAAARGHAFVGTEHLLLAMTRQTEDSFARRLLDEVGATQSLRSRIEAAIGEG
jgi:hypothetical protein